MKQFPLFLLFIVAAKPNLKAQSYLPLTGGTLTGNLTINSGYQLQAPYHGFNAGVTQPANSNSVALFTNSTTTTLDLVGWGSGWRFIPNNTTTYATPVVTIDQNGTLTTRNYLSIASNQFGNQIKFTDATGGSTAWWMGLTDASGTYFSIGDGGTNSNRLVIRKAMGYVGINNPNPLTPLDVAGTIKGGAFMASSASTTDVLTHNGVSMSHYALAWANDSWQTGASTAWLSGYGGIKLFTGGTNRINVDVNGNVGIGKIATAKLDINGGVYANAESHYYIGSFTDPDVGTTHAIKVGSNGIAVSGNSVFSNGYVMIGAYPPTMNTSYLLNVNGDARVDKLVVNTTGADFVFEPGYKLTPLNLVERYINENRHLPGIETARAMQKDGVDVGDNQTKLLQKIEELTLYAIAQDKKAQQSEEQNIELNKLLKQQAAQLHQQQIMLTKLQQQIEIITGSKK